MEVLAAKSSLRLMWAVCSVNKISSSNGFIASSLESWYKPASLRIAVPLATAFDLRLHSNTASSRSRGARTTAPSRSEASLANRAGAGGDLNWHSKSVHTASMPKNSSWMVRGSGRRRCR
eukprot:965102-Amphidinium_carterae.3